MRKHVETLRGVFATVGQTLRDLDRAHLLRLLATGKAPRTPQDEKAMTHCRKLLREHGVIDWSQPAQEIARRVRA